MPLTVLPDHEAYPSLGPNVDKKWLRVIKPIGELAPVLFCTHIWTSPFWYTGFTDLQSCEDSNRRLMP
ncbi:hypothetical protein Tdes44962_MAKER05280 [Teratosphaeria destructans]|uniref:Uncharacterized protein n=1 Tax=Teratosphaeria destructans TaxID=418781 RepID=A0A9W7VYU4_9PEZI|nr:hypothetical protein Tdes44962_MAKER05280 [Teratosphaeria destructans]